MDENALQHLKIEGVADYTDAIDTVIGRAHRTIRAFDHNLEGIGFNSLKRYELLRSFLLAERGNRLFVVVHNTDYLNQNCPRMLMLLKQFSHAMQIHQTHSHAQGIYDPFVIADGSHYVHRFHFQDSRGLLGLNDPQGAQTLNQRFDEIWEASFPAISATTLGL